MNERLNGGKAATYNCTESTSLTPATRSGPRTFLNPVSAPTQTTADLITSVKRTSPAGRLASCRENNGLIEHFHVCLEWRGGVVCGCLGRLWFPPASELMVKQMCGQDGQCFRSGGGGCLVRKSHWLSDLECSIYHCGDSVQT